MNVYNFLVLIVVIAILAIFAWKGYSSGVIKMLVSVVALAASILLASLLTQPVGNFVKENTQIYQRIEHSVLEVVSAHCDLNDSEWVKELPFPEYMTEQVLEEGIPLNEMAESISAAIADKIFRSIIYIVLNIVVFIGIRIMMSVFQVISRLPVIKEVNHIAGLVVGLAEGLLVVWLAALLLQAFAGESWAQEIFRQIHESQFLTFLYKNNLLLKILG